MEGQRPKKAVPLKVYGRGHYACTRCKASKIKCSGEKPACANCKQVGKQNICHYESRDRKIVIMESDFKQLQSQVQYLEDVIRLQGVSPNASKREESPSEQWSTNAQKREQESDLGPEDYLLADADNDVVSPKLLQLCMNTLPLQEYAINRISQARRAYASEFYLSTGDELDYMVPQIYDYFASMNKGEITHTSRPPLSAVLLCHFFALLAFGEQIANATSDTLALSLSEFVTNTPKKVPGLEYYSLATKLFHVNYEQPSIRYIQSALTLGFFASNINRHSTVYKFFGVALRSAVGNGYHRRLEMPVNLTPEAMRDHMIYQEKTKRLWWTIFVVDIICAAKMNMPVHIEYTDTDVALPTEGPKVDLNDSFDLELLECYVHLAKYMSKFIKVIYGPNMRTMTVNYITTDSMSQKLMVKNILRCVDSFVTDFKETTLVPFTSNVVLPRGGREVENLLIRSNQALMDVIGPALSLIFEKNGTTYADNTENLMGAITRVVAAAAQNVRIFIKLYEHNKLFVLGFWDAFQLFCGLLVLIIGSGPGRNAVYCNQAYALLKYMAENNNTNARNFLQKIGVVHEFFVGTPDIYSVLDLNCTISDFVTPNDGGHAQNGGMGFDVPSMSDYGLDKHEYADPKSGTLYQRLGFNICDASRERLLLLTKSIFYWIIYNGLPIHLSGTARCPVFSRSPSDPGTMHLL